MAEEVRSSSEDPSRKKQARGKLSPEEWAKKKQALAAEPGTFVVKGNTLESRWLLNRIREYDRLLGWLKSHIGVDIDTTKALEIIEKCKTVENAFQDNLEVLREFVKSHQNKGKDNGNGQHTQTEEAAGDLAPSESAAPAV